MPNPLPFPALASFQRAARCVPAYRTLLAEAGIRADAIRDGQDFARLPVLEKRNTFQRFPIDQLCADGKLGDLASVLTSSGHSGVFAFGLTERAAVPATAQGIDDLLDQLFAVRSQATLLINCLPMGVKVPTVACVLAETSVRADMAVGLVRAFGKNFAQLILVGDAAFLKHLLELGRRAGVHWPDHRVHLIAGEETLAENARSYLEAILGIDHRQPGHALVLSSMGVAELGLNLFAEAPPRDVLVRLRRLLHGNAALRELVLGPRDWVPSLFTYDPRRIYVEFDSGGRLIVTTLDPQVRVPLIRYATGDRGRPLELLPAVRPMLEQAGVAWQDLASLPVVAIDGRGDYAKAGEGAVYPEAVKEGIYFDSTLAELTTANFRLSSGDARARLRIQLSPGVQPTAPLAERFRLAIQRYVHQPLEVACEAYEDFGPGMALDYERKFQYLES